MPIGGSDNYLLSVFYKNKNMKKLILLLFLSPFITEAQQWYPMDVGVNNTIGNCGIGDITSYQGKIVIGGHFKYSGTTVVNSVAQWDGFHWQPMGLGVWDQGAVDQTGYAFRFFNYNSRLYCGGVFLGAGGSFVNDASHYANCIAYWDNTDWHHLSPGPSPSGVNGSVAGIGLYNNHLFFGGNFINSFDSSGSTPVHELAEWNDTTFLPPPGLLSGNYNFGFADIFEFTNYNNKLVMVGQFNSINGSPFGASGFIAGWDDSIWTTFSNGFNATAFSTVIYNGELYAAGVFTATGDNLTALNHVAKWNGTQWLQVGEGLNDTVVTLYVDTIANKLYAGGMFTQTGLGVSAKHIAEWNGNNWLEVGGGTNGVVNPIYAKDSNLYIGGGFSQVGAGINANHIACWGHSPLGVGEVKDENTLNISPNPATNEIMLTSNQKLKTIHIYIVLGEEVLKLERIANSQKAIDISSWKAGVYFVEVETEKGIVRKRLVKE